MRAHTVLLAAVVLGVCPPARADLDRGSPVDLYASGQPVASQPLSAARNKPIPIAGRGTMTAGEISKLSFADQDQFTAELTAGKAALFGAPRVTSEVVEYDDVTVLTTTTARSPWPTASGCKIAPPTFAR